MASSSVISSLARDKNDPTVWAALAAALGDKAWAIRAAAVHVIAMHDDPALIDKLVPLMDDKKQQVSFRAAAGYLRLTIIAQKSQELFVSPTISAAIPRKPQSKRVFLQAIGADRPPSSAR
jgi:HEAT repeat protein